MPAPRLLARAATFSLFVGLLAACPGNDKPGDEVEVELGTGTVEFEPLGAELDLITGPQGGHHFIVHARAKDILPGDPSIPGAPGNPTTRFAAFDANGTQIDAMFPPYQLGFRDGGSGWFDLPSGRLLVIDEEHVAQVYGAQIRITVDIEDAQGKSGHDETTITATEGELPDGDAGPGDAGPGDAGPGDAGVIDAP